MIKLNLLVTSLITLIILNSCEKGPYFTIVDGYVIDHVDSSKVPEALVVVIHWDGNDKSDSTAILKTKCDSLGKFNFQFEAEKKHDFYWAKAEKDGFTYSSMEQIDVNSNMGCIIKLYH